MEYHAVKELLATTNSNLKALAIHAARIADALEERNKIEREWLEEEDGADVVKIDGGNIFSGLPLGIGTEQWEKFTRGMEELRAAREIEKHP